MLLRDCSFIINVLPTFSQIIIKILNALWALLSSSPSDWYFRLFLASPTFGLRRCELASPHPSTIRFLTAVPC